MAKMQVVKPYKKDSWELPARSVAHGDEETDPIIERLKVTGHLDYPFNKKQEISKPLFRLTLKDAEVVKAIASIQDFDPVNLDLLSHKHNGRAAYHDGDVGPATRELILGDRCAHPDYGPEVQAAVGTGGWQRCHGVGDFHCAKVYINESGMGSHLKPVFEAVWQGTVKAYAEVGLLLIRTTVKGDANMTMEFVSRSGGWIGLALIGPGTCKNQIWQKYLASYKGNNVQREWITLMMHEAGHNVGLQHSRGGVMNPSIISGLPGRWMGVSDPHEPTLKRMYGGVAVPIPGPGPGPGPEPPKGQVAVSIRSADGKFYEGFIPEVLYKF